MEKIDFLNYRALVLEVRQLKAYVETLDRALSSIPSPQYSFTPKAPHSGGSALESRVVRYLEMKDLYEAQRSEAEAQVVAVERAIQSLDSPAERLVMRLRYLEGRSWTSVCARLQCEGYSERSVYRLHGSALLKLKEV
jgi:DNA-directed RNA polymerase specialized sigma24 family protein